MYASSRSNSAGVTRYAAAIAIAQARARVHGEERITLRPRERALRRRQLEGTGDRCRRAARQDDRSGPGEHRVPPGGLEPADDGKTRGQPDVVRIEPRDLIERIGGIRVDA